MISNRGCCCCRWWCWSRQLRCCCGENGRDAIAGGGGGGEAKEGITTVLVGRRRGAHLAVGCGVAREDDVTDVAVPSTRHDMTAAVAAD